LGGERIESIDHALSPVGYRRRVERRAAASISSRRCILDQDFGWLAGRFVMVPGAASTSG
jgi:hypothetical protein